MRYFSGFCFKNEQDLFDDILLKNDFCVAGFSYGAIKAFEYTYNLNKRVDTLQLISPAFFQDRNDRFISLQLRAFSKDRDKYLKNFYQNSLYPLKIDIKRFYSTGNTEELKELLNYKWDIKKIEQTVKRGVKLEVFLGSYDKIINPNVVKDFFTPFATIYWFNNLGHIIGEKHGYKDRSFNSIRQSERRSL